MTRLLATLTALIATAGVGLTQPAAAQETITVFAAASLKNALDDVDSAYAKASGVKVK